MARRLCVVCGERPAAVPDRERPGYTDAAVCRPCHAGRLQEDLARVFGPEAVYGAPGPAPQEAPVGERETDVFLFAERTAMLLACLRNYERSGQPVDLGGAYRLLPEVARLLARVRERLPRPG